ncbi:HDIG domain-containing metalloprotein [Desulfovibrio sp. ZJ200]|uniref:HDIG domain-containing metalloprotein n=1 Tax=Desulfovibrio sp. ZJ200 TaxID=2709792 RepID=UPI0013EA860E|nr:HDIG domain-containing metalloprotein [Desulfovibrio sp. ZJ200]
MNNFHAACPDGREPACRPFARLPEPRALGLGLASSAPVPGDQACFALWKKYAMLPNIQRHSLLVARIATELARRAAEKGFAVNVPQVRASALLHDIAKSYCVRHGGSHAQLGAGWVVAETRNYAVAQGVMLHVHWPWPLPEGAGICALPFFVIYADKRVRHDSCVSLAERYEDLLERYGHSEAARQGIRASYEQGRNIERALSAQLGWALHEDSFDCGRLVQ